MLPRVQRIAAAIEIFALVLWVGGLFFFLAFAEPAARAAFAENTDAAASTANNMLERFAGLEMVFATVVLASNFFKVLLFKNASALQRLALLVSAIMLLFSAVHAQKLRPMIGEKLDEISVMTQPNAVMAREKLKPLVERRRVVLGINLIMGLFLVYSYRSFEERKMHALANIIKTS